MVNKQYKDTRSGEVVERFNIMDIKFMQELDSSTPCPKCKEFKLTINNSWNALSRRDNASICSDCGQAEALEDFAVVHNNESDQDTQELDEEFRSQAIAFCMDLGLPEDEAELMTDDYIGLF